MPSTRARAEVVEAFVSEYATLASVTAFTEHQLKQIFDQDEMKEINDFLVEMNSATNENGKRAKLIEGIEKYADVVLKLVRKVGGIPV